MQVSLHNTGQSRETWEIRNHQRYTLQCPPSRAWLQSLHARHWRGSLDLEIHNRFLVTTGHQISSPVLLMKSSSLEHTRRILRLWLKGIEVVQCLGWQLSGRRYWCVSVGFVYKSVRIVPPSRMTIVSKKDTRCINHSAVNFNGHMEHVYPLDEDLEFILPRIQYGKDVIDISPPHQGQVSVQASKASSKWAMNKLAYDSAHPGAHGRTLGLQIMFPVEREMVEGENLNFGSWFDHVLEWWKHRDCALPEA